MKDSYTFDRDARGPRRALRASTARPTTAIFDRCGLEWYRVESDVGMMGGLGAHEYMAPCPAGENDVALAPGLRRQRRGRQRRRRSRSSCRPALDAPEEVDTPGLTTVADGRRALGVPRGRAAEGLPGRWSTTAGSCSCVVRGDHRVNEIKLAATRSARRSGPRARTSSRERIGPAGYIGPVGIDVPILLDDAVEPGALHRRRQPARTRTCAASSRAATSPSSAATCARSRRATPSTAARSGSSPRSRSATSSSSARATPSRSARPTSTSPARRSSIWMGSYGIGPARIAAAAVEQFADEQGISWPRSIAPFDVAPRRARQARAREERALAERLYEELRETGLRRDLRRPRRRARARSSPTPSCSACPLRLTVGRRTLAAGEVEVQVRRGRETALRPARGRRRGGGVASLWRDAPSRRSERRQAETAERAG